MLDDLKKLDKLVTKKKFPILYQCKNSFEKALLFDELENLIKEFKAESLVPDTRSSRRSERFDLKALTTLINGDLEEKMVLTNISVTGMKTLVHSAYHIPVAPQSPFKIKIKFLRGGDKGKEVVVEAKLIRFADAGEKGLVELCFDYLNPAEEQIKMIRDFIDVYKDLYK